MTGQLLVGVMFIGVRGIYFVCNGTYVSTKIEVEVIYDMIQKVAFINRIVKYQNMQQAYIKQSYLFIVSCDDICKELSE